MQLTVKFIEGKRTYVYSILIVSIIEPLLTELLLIGVSIKRADNEIWFFLPNDWVLKKTMHFKTLSALQALADSTTISHTEVVQAITIALKYIEKNNVTPIDLPLLKNLRDRTATDRKSGYLHWKVKEFFYKVM